MRRHHLCARVDRELPRPFGYVEVVIVETQSAGKCERGFERLQLFDRRVAHEMREPRAVRRPPGPVDQDHASCGPMRADSFMMCSTHHPGAEFINVARSQ